jgi:uncharacterized protein DUF1559
VSGPGSGYLGNPLALYNWLTVDTIGTVATGESNPNGTLQLTGTSFQRSQVGIKHIPDGTSHTYLVGEKFLIIDTYETGTDTGDNETWCTGHNNDNLRTTAEPPKQDQACLGNVNNCTNENGNIFGSAHATGWYASFCDGHVEYVSFDIDPTVHKNRGNRLDGNVPGGP